MTEPEFVPKGEDNTEHIRTTQEARQAVPIGRMRYVLAIGIALVVLMFALIWYGVL
jgi:hypothetical protein